MKDTLLQIYSSTEKSFKEPRKPQNIFNVSFDNGPKVSVSGEVEAQYNVKFINKKTGDLSYKTQIKNNMWAKSTIGYFVDWRIEVESEGNLVFSHDLNLENKKVLVVIDSRSIGDIIAYTPQIDLFQAKHKCVLDVLAPHPELAEILDCSYENMNFVADPVENKYYAVYRIGYPLENWQNSNPADPKSLSLQQVASSVLGLEFKEHRPVLTFANEAGKINKKYVCIATQSTAQCKYWNNATGWEEVIKYLNKAGYDVWCIDRHSSYGNKEKKFNYIPKGAIDKTGDFPLELRMSQIYNSEFFIGLGSGLSWLAWALEKPVVLISGFSKPFAEFSTPYRVHNENVCNGCWNDTSLKFDKADWMWCPRQKNFECSKEISAQMVIDKINLLIKPEVKDENFASIILCHPNSLKKNQVLKRCIGMAKGTKIVSSNYQLDEETQKIADFCLVTNKNEVLYKEEFDKFSCNFYLNSSNEFGLFSNEFEFEHGYAVYSLIKNGLKFAKALGFDKVHVINYDYFITEDTFNKHALMLKQNDCIFYDYQKAFYDEWSFCTGFFSGKIDVLLKFFSKYSDKESYYKDLVQPVNILEIKTFLFFNKNDYKIARLPHKQLKEDGNNCDFIAVTSREVEINIPL